MKKIGLKELHSMASQMKYHDFENWVAKELFDQPETVDTSELTNRLFLANVENLKQQLEEAKKREQKVVDAWNKFDYEDAFYDMDEAVQNITNQNQEG